MRCSHVYPLQSTRSELHRMAQEHADKLLSLYRYMLGLSTHEDNKQRSRRLEKEKNKQPVKENLVIYQKWLLKNGY